MNSTNKLPMERKLNTYLNSAAKAISVFVMAVCLLSNTVVGQSGNIRLDAGQTTSICRGNSVTLNSLLSVPNSGTTVNFLTDNPSNSVDLATLPNYIALPANFNNNFTEGFTFECWVKPGGALNFYNRILRIGAINFEIARDNLNYFIEGVSSGAADPTAVPINGTWQHVAFTLDGTNLRFYVNGVLNHTQLHNRLPYMDAGGNNTIGANTSGGSETFKGNMDEIRFWNVARTDAQIEQTYQRSVNNNASGLVAYYRSDETVGSFPTTLQNAVGNSASTVATLVNFPSTGTSAISASDITGFSSNNLNITWTPTNGLNTNTGIRVIASPLITTLYTASGTDIFGTTVTDTITINVATTDAPEITPTSFTGCVNQINLSTSSPGPYLWSNGDTSRSITVSTSGLYFVTVGTCSSNIVPVNFAANNTVTRPTIVRSTNNIICSGDSIELRALAFSLNAGNAISFPNANPVASTDPATLPNYIQLPADFNTRFTSGFTFECWVKPQQMNDYNRLVRIGNINFEIARGAMEFYFEGITGGAGGPGVAAGNAPVVGTWQHVAFTLDGTDLKFYINGELKYTRANTAFPSTQPNGNNFIGISGLTDGSSSFKGQLDEIKLWNIARSQTEILETLNQSTPDNTVGLVAYFNADVLPGTPTTFLPNIARTTLANIGTMVNFPSTGESVFTASTIPTFASDNVRYVWSPSSSLNTAQGSRVIARPETNTTYSVTAINITGCSFTNSITLEVNPAPSIQNQPIGIQRFVSESATFTVGAIGFGTLNYQWQVSTDNGTTFNNVSDTNNYAGINSPSLTIDSLSASFNDNIYRCYISGCGTPTTSNAATLTVIVPVIDEYLWDTFRGLRRVSYGSRSGILSVQDNPNAYYPYGYPVVGSYARTSDTNDAIVVKFPALQDLQAYRNNLKRFNINIYSQTPGTAVRFILQDSLVVNSTNFPTGRYAIFNGVTTKTNQWETVVLRCTSWPDSSLSPNQVNTMSIAFNPGSSNSGQFFFDNLNGPVFESDVINSNTQRLTNSNLQCFPNPAKDVLNINFNLTKGNSFTIEISDLQGKVLTKTSSKNRNTGLIQEKLNTGALTNGLYFCTINTESGTTTKKFSIAK